MSKVFAIRSSALVAFALLLPLTSAAQVIGGGGGGEVRRPYRSLFGGDPNDATASNVSVSFSGGYEDNVAPPSGPGVDPRFQTSSMTGGVSASLTLQHSTEKASVGLSASSNLRYFDNGEALESLAHGVAAFGRTQLGSRTTVAVTGGFTWAPLYSPLLNNSGFGTGPITTPPPLGIGTDYSVASRPATFSHASVSASHSLGRRTSVLAGYGMAFEHYTDEDHQQRAHTMHGGVSYRLTRYSSLRLSYRRTDYHLDGDVRRRGIDELSGGIDYSRPFSLSGRRTTFTITPGIALDSRQGGTRVHATGSANLNHEIGRTWTARATYQRGFRFVDGLGAQMLANTGTATVQGLLTRRIGAGFGGQFVMSGSKDSQDVGGYHAYMATAGGNYAITRNVSAFVQYAFFSYRFSDSVALPSSVGQQLDRQSIRVGISLWAPVLR
jgi:hypothetical protein